MTKPDDAASKRSDQDDEKNRGGAAPSERVPRSWRLVGYAILAVVLLTAFDLWTKTLAEEHLSRARQGSAPALCVPDERGYVGMQRLRAEPHVLVEGLLDLEYAENCGAAFGMMRNAPAAARGAVFGLAALVAVLALFFLFRTGRGGVWLAWGVPFVASGALGNLIDRIRYGYVVDFIHVHYRPWDFDYPTFNVADIAITVGVACLIIDAFRSERATDDPKATKAAAATTSGDGSSGEPDEKPEDDASPRAPAGADSRGHDEESEASST